MINSISISKTAKFVTYGDPKTAKTILFVLHGYGQLADFFIRKFHVLNESDFFIVAPEGLHRFYLKGASGRVGASWMTKEKREEDIQDYVLFLDKLWAELRKEYKFERKILLGFSQGGATASRWHNKGNFFADDFLLWAAVFPSDMKLEFENEFKKSNNVFILGTEDEYLTESQGKLHLEEIESNDLKFKYVKFNGNHNIDGKTLLNLIV